MLQMDVSQLTVVWTLMACVTLEHGLAQDEIGAPEHWCEGESFRPKCAADDVIIVHSAAYGRMSAGRCLREALPVPGCRRDVLAHMDRLCSGRRRCDVRVSSLIDAVTGNVPSCLLDHRGYLEITYSCVRAAKQPMDDCMTQQYVSAPITSSGDAVSSRNEGYLTSVVAQETGGGSLKCPWLIRLSPGQTVALYLYDFTAASSSSSSSSSFSSSSSDSLCSVLAVVKERGRWRSDTVCAGRQRFGLVYTSIGNEVEVRFATKPVDGTAAAATDTDDVTASYVIKYVAVGCADLAPPQYGWAVRHNDVTTIGCNSSARATWQVTCVDGQWQGETQNCSRSLPEIAAIGESRDGVLSALLLHENISIIAIVFIAAMLGIVILIAGLFVLKRNQSKCATSASGQYPLAAYAPAQYHEPSMAYTMADGVGAESVKYATPPSEIGSSKLTRHASLDARGNDYYRTWHHLLQRQQLQQQRAYNVSDVMDLECDVSALASSAGSGAPFFSHQPYHHHHDPSRYNSFHFHRQHGTIVEHIYESPRFNRKPLPVQPPLAGLA